MVAAIFKMCDGRNNVQDIFYLVSKRFDLPKDQLTEIVNKTLSALKSDNVIVFTDTKSPELKQPIRLKRRKLKEELRNVIISVTNRCNLRMHTLFC